MYFIYISLVENNSFYMLYVSSCPKYNIYTSPPERYFKVGINKILLNPIFKVCIKKNVRVYGSTYIKTKKKQKKIIKKLIRL